ncbi:hypothetical protein [Ketogulonicigenium robustum]|uniref:hypothetical protein n=1 Tax=Ketogulonicigenium robustum TaxID=92947 RepID=UPI000A26C26C|nr:hypothetical protein [Ketogulonicigenium robustum]
MARTSVERQLERAKEAKARAEAQIRQAGAKLRAEDRKKDARRKIVLGGAVIGQAAKDPQWVKVLRMAIASMPERDRALFEGWTLPKPETVSKEQPG